MIFIKLFAFLFLKHQWANHIISKNKLKDFEKNNTLNSTIDKIIKSQTPDLLCGNFSESLEINLLLKFLF